MVDNKAPEGVQGEEHKGLRILHVPDLHLYDKEIGVSRGYPEQSVDILNSIKDEVMSGEYDIVTLGGDIQHAKINNTRYISEFQKGLTEIGELVRKRLEETRLLEELKVYDCEGDIIDIESMTSVLFSVRGNHDTNSIEEFTFFDLLLDNRVILNPRTIRIKDLQINFINYSKLIGELSEDKHEDAKTLISIYHNPILEKGIFIDTYIGTTISPTSHSIFNKVDLALVNDIHIPIPIYDVAKGINKTTVVTPGSLGRTSFNSSHDRDYGNIVKIEVSEECDLEVSLLEVELVPADEFFNKAEAHKKKRVENAFKNFCIEIEDASMNYFDINEEIEKIDIDEEIKDICKEIMRQVE